MKLVCNNVHWAYVNLMGISCDALILLRVLFLQIHQI